MLLVSVMADAASKKIVGMIAFHKYAMNQRRTTCLVATDLVAGPTHSDVAPLEVSICLVLDSPFRLNTRGTRYDVSIAVVGHPIL